MKTNEFDSRIKQGLENLNPVFNEQDWIRLQTKMNTAVDRKPVRSRYLLILLLLFAGLGAGVLAWSISGSRSGNGHNTNQQILASEDVDNGDVMVEKTAVIENKNKASEIKNASTDNSRNSFKVQNNASGKMPFDELMNRSKTEKNDTPSGTEMQWSTKTPDHSGLSDESKNIALLNLKNAEVIQMSGTEERAKTIESGSIPSLMVKKIQSNKTKGNALNKLVKVKSGPEVSRWSAGIAGLITGSHYSGGLAVQMAVNKNISLRSGLMNQRFFAQTYQDEQVFVDENDFEFTELAKPRHSRSTNFSNIRVNSSDWVMPLELKYTHPLSFNTSLYFSGGLQLTLKSKTELDFEYKAYDTNQDMSEFDFVQASNNATLMNNFCLGLGWQYTLRNLQYQIGVIYQKNNSNLPLLAKKEIGLMAGLSYAF